MKGQTTFVSKRVIVLFLLSVLCVAVGIIAFLARRDMHYESAYASVLPGTPKSIVLQQFGKPEDIRHCSLKSWDGDPIKVKPSECVEELWYFSRISPEQWVIGFDQKGRAVAKYHMVSP